MTSTRTCETVSCDKPAQLQCPKCKDLGIVEGSYFCSQECFTKSYSTHKGLHKSGKASTSNGTSEQMSTYDPWPYFKFTGNLRPYPTSPKRVVPARIPRPDYGTHPEGQPLSELALRGQSHAIKILSNDEIELMRITCKLAREVLDEAAAAVQEGVTTDEIDRVVHEACIDRECYPSPLNYYQFPKSCCTSVNEVICHGIPDKRTLQAGDICNVDVTVYYRGFHGDLNETIYVGTPSLNAQKLVNNTWECLQKAIELVKPGTKYRDIGNVIQKHAQASNFSVVRSYCGHGIHSLFHTAPSIPHYAKNKATGVMKPGHCFTIEPMISEGTWRDVTWPDDWTAVTQDGKLSAQFEETLLVTDTGVENLTRRRTNGGLPYFKG